MEKFFLYKVYRHNKKLFFFFLVFTALTVFCNLTGFEITPFYVWGMYSQKEESPKEYPVFKITADDKLIDYSTGFFPANRFMLLSPLSYYASFKTAEDPTAVFLERKLKQRFQLIQPYAAEVLNSKNEAAKFLAWLKHYAEQSTGNSINDLKVDLLMVSYEDDGSIKINSAHTLIDEK